MSTAARSYLCQSVVVIDPITTLATPGTPSERDSIAGRRAATTRVMLPKLLDWYRRDFGMSTQEVLLRVAALLHDQHDGPGRINDDCSQREKMVREAAMLPESDLEIDYLNYSWAQPEHR